MILVTKWFGTFLCEPGKVVDKRLFPKDSESIASRLKRIRGGEILEEEMELGARAKGVGEKRLGRIAEVVAFDSSFIRPGKHGFDVEILRQASLKLAIESLGEEDPGAYITEQVRAFDDLVATCNLMSERLREWYGLYFPELERQVDDKRYAELIAEDPNREKIAVEIGKPEAASSGIELSEADLAAIRALAQSTVGTFGARKQIENSIQRKMKDEAGNLAAIAGPIIGARLISLSGGLKRMARMPSSTVQLLGAEKAIFRHLKDNSPPPKHGVIFQHPFLHNAPYWQRGKIARALAGKISLAVKADYFGEEDFSEELTRSLESRISEIKKKYPNPPAKPARKRKKGMEKRRRNR